MLAVKDFPSYPAQLKAIAGDLKTLESESQKVRGALDMEHSTVAGLLQCLLSEHPSTVKWCCDALVVAACRGWVQHDSLLGALSAHASSMRHASMAICAVGQLLVTEAKRLREGYVCPYSLRTNMHPFLSMLNARPDCGTYIVFEIQALLSYRMDSQVNLLHMLEPAIKYILLHPNPTPELASLSHQLHTSLLNICRLLKQNQDTVASIASLLVRLFPLWQISTDHQLICAVTSAQTLIEIVVQMEQSTRAEIEEVLTTVALSLCCECAQRGLVPMQLVHCIQEHMVLTHLHHHFAVSWMLVQALPHPHLVSSLLTLVNAVIDTTSYMAKCLYVYPLVQILSQSSVLTPISRDTVSSNHKQAGEILAKIPWNSEATGCKGIKEEEEDTKPCCSPCSPLYSLLEAASQLYWSCCKTKKPHASMLQALIKGLKRAGTVPSSSISHLAILICGLCWRLGNSLVPPEVKSDDTLPRAGNKSDELDKLDESDELDDILPQAGAELKNILKLFGCLACSDPTMSPCLLPCLLHLQSLPSSQDTMLAIMHSFPRLATHPVATGSVVPTLLFLARTPGLRALSVRLLGKTWARQDGVFGKLKELLVQPISPTLPNSIMKELDVAHAAVLYDICRLRPEQHGEEVLSLVYGALRGSRNPIVQRMMVEGLIALCNAEVVDVVTLWGVLGDQLSTLESPAMVATVCRLLALGASIDVQKDSHKAFKAKALKRLWSTLSVGTHAKNYTVCSGVLEVLGKFRSCDDLIKYIPRELCLQLGVSEEVLVSLSSNPDPEPLLEGRHYVALLPLVPEGSLDQYQTFLGSRLTEEVKQLPRGAILTAVKEAGSVTSLDRDLLAAMKKIMKNAMKTNPLSTTTEPDVGIPLADQYLRLSSELWAAVPSGDSPDLHLLGRRAIEEDMAKCISRLEELLNGKTLCPPLLEPDDQLLNVFVCSRLVNQWTAFMAGVSQTCMKAQLLKISPLLAREDPNSTVLAEKQKEAYKMTYHHLLSKVIANAPPSPNVLFAVVGMTVALGHVEPLWVQQLLCSLGIMLGCGGNLKATPPLCDVLPPRKGTTGVINLIPMEPFIALCLPAVVHTILCHCLVLPSHTRVLLEDIIATLTEQFIKSPQWHLASSLNHLLTLTPSYSITPNASFNKLLPLMDFSESLRLLSLMTSFIPAYRCYSDRRDLSQKLLSASVKLLKGDDLTAIPMQMLAINVAMNMSMMSTDIDVSSFLVTLADAATKCPQVPAYHLSLAMALHGLCCASYPDMIHTMDAIAAKWIQELSEGTTNVIPILFGLAGLLGMKVPQLLDKPHTAYSSVTVKFTSLLFPLTIEKLEKLVSSEEGLSKAVSLWVMQEVTGNLSMMQEAREKVPLTYSYLAEGSILATLASVLRDRAATPLNQTTMAQVKAILEVLGGAMGSLPPIDFSDILIPICNYKELQTSAISCFTQCGVPLTPTSHHQPSPLGFSQFSHLCSNAHFFLSLSTEAQTLLSQNIHQLLNVFNHYDFCRLLHVMVLQSLDPQLRPPALCAVLTGMIKSFQQEGLGAPLRRILANVAKQLCILLRGENLCSVVIRDSSLMEHVANCMSYVEDRGELLSLSSTANSISDGVFNSILHCCQVKSGKQDIVALRPVLEWNLNSITDGTSKDKLTPSLSWLLRAVYHCCSSQHAKNSLLNQTDLLQTLVCWTRAHPPSAEQMRLVFSLTSCILMASVAFSPDLSFLLVTGDHVEHLLCDLWESPYISFTPQERLLKEKVCQCLTEWVTVQGKAGRHMYLKFLCAFKSTEEYQKPIIWTTLAHAL